jgi:hypothetical protein
MCEFEENILKLLKEEKTHLSKVFTEKEAPYMKSLEHGIQSAENKLKECKYKQCVENVYKKNPGIVPAMNLGQWSNIQIDIFNCKKD